MEQKRRVGYAIQREVLDEQNVEELAEKSDAKTPLSEKIKKSLR